MIDFEELGYDSAWDREFSALGLQGTVPGRVVSLDRGFPLVSTRDEELRAEPAAALKKGDASPASIGDWVALRLPEGHDKAIIEAVLPRRTEIARAKRVGRERQPKRQVLAANVDRVLICQSLTGEGLDRSLALRQMVAVFGSGAQPAFVLTKNDIADPECVVQARDYLQGVAPDVPVFIISSATGLGLEQVRELCPAKTTTMLLGESGVGKSTLINGLLGEEALKTGEVREADDKGRHTTVARRMLAVPGAGLIIDAPGLRTLQIIDMQDCLQKAFPDVCDLAVECRFRDCTHTHEPGCAVVGVIAAPRLEAFLSLASR